MLSPAELPDTIAAPFYHAGSRLEPIAGFSVRILRNLRAAFTGYKKTSSQMFSVKPENIKRNEQWVGSSFAWQAHFEDLPPSNTR